MNGAECGKCGEIQCVCREIEKREKENRASELLKILEIDTTELYYAVIKPKGLRLRLLKWLYPEIVKVVDSLKRCYWSRDIETVLVMTKVMYARQQEQSGNKKRRREATLERRKNRVIRRSHKKKQS